MNKRIRIFGVVIIIIVTFGGTACGKKDDNNTSSLTTMTPPTEIEEKLTAGEVSINMAVQEYQGDNIVEIPEFKCTGASEAIDNLNKNKTFLKDIYESLETERWAEIKAFPLKGGKYLQAIVTYITYPNYGTDPCVLSMVYDIKEDSIITNNDALLRAGIDETTLKTNVGELFNSMQNDDVLFSDATIDGFRIHENEESEYIEFFVSVNYTCTEADPWITSYSYIPSQNKLTLIENGKAVNDKENIMKFDTPLNVFNEE